MPGSLYIATHIWNLCPVQIKAIFIITVKSACRAHMQMCVANGGEFVSILLALGRCISFPHDVDLVMITADIYHILLMLFFMILQEIIRTEFVFFIFILWNFKLNSDTVERREIAQGRNVLQINSTQKPYLTWIKINVALCSLFISIMWEICYWAMKNQMLRKLPFFLWKISN